MLAASTARAIEFSLVISLSALEVNTIGAFAPTIRPAFSPFAKNTSDLYKIFPDYIFGTKRISAFPPIG